MLGDFAVWYLFLGGAGAGLLFVTALLESLTPCEVRCQAGTGVAVTCGRRVAYAPRAAYSRFFGPAYVAGVVVVAVGMLCLLFDVGRVDRVLSLFLQPTLSFISVGAYVLAALLACAAVPTAVWAAGAPVPRRSVTIARACIMVLALAVMAYTGLFLASMRAVPLWHSPWLPALFVVSSVSCGSALLVGAVVLTGSAEEFRGTVRRVQKADAALIAAELAVLCLFVGAAWFAGTPEGLADQTAVAGGRVSIDATARQAAANLVSGALAAPFWGLLVAFGLAVPLAVELFGRSLDERAALAAATLVLIGGFFLRWCVVAAGAPVDIEAFVFAATNVVLG